MPEPHNILIVGVGGQGTILAGKVLSCAAVLAGHDVKFSEIHGMAQRGGSVVTQIRVGERVYAPVVDPGTADVVLAFELLEGLRWQHMLKPGGLLIVGTQVIEPASVLMGAATYPTAATEAMLSEPNVRALDALTMAKEAGNARASNIVLLGRLARELHIAREIWERALEEATPSRFLDSNRRAFAAGWDAAQS